jgi:hypothetical protein
VTFILSGIVIPLLKKKCAEDSMSFLKFIFIAIIALSSAALYAVDDSAEKKGKSDTPATVPADNNTPEDKGKRIPPSTLFGVKPVISGFGAISWQGTKIGKEDYANLLGGRAGLIVNEYLVIGGAGYGLVYPRQRTHMTGKTYVGDYPDMYMGYGGGLVELHIAPKSLLHVSLGTIVGGGGYGFYNRHGIDDSAKREHEGKNIFFVVQPEVMLYLNVTRFCRIGAGVAYRYTHGAKGEVFDDKDFRQFGVTGLVAFGWF